MNSTGHLKNSFRNTYVDHFDIPIQLRCVDQSWRECDELSKTDFAGVTGITIGMLMGGTVTSPVSICGH